MNTHPLRLIATLLTGLWFASPALAQRDLDDDEPGRRPAPKPPATPASPGLGAETRLTPAEIKAYDKDGDGKLNAAERAAALKGIQDRRIAAIQKRQEAFISKFDLDRDGKLNDEERRKAEAAQRAEAEKRRMEEFDKDKDGKLNVAELNAMLKAGLGPVGYERVLKKHDKDMDGKINDAEYQAYQKEMRDAEQKWEADREKRRLEFIKKYDRNKDGKVSDEERAAAEKDALDQRRNRAAELLKQFDKNGDGKLDPQERKASLQAQSSGASDKPVQKPAGEK